MIYPYLKSTAILSDNALEQATVSAAQQDLSLINMLEEEDFTDKQLWLLLKSFVPDKKNGVINVMLTDERVAQEDSLTNLKDYAWLDFINKASYKGPWEQLFANMRLLRLRRMASEFKSSALDEDIPAEFLQKSTQLASLIPGNNELKEIMVEMGQAPPVIKTGYSLIDDVGGIPQGSVVVVASETAVGKTTLAINMANKFLKAGLGVHYVSLEMQARMIALKLLQIRHKCSAQEAGEAKDLLMEFEGKLHIDDRKTKFVDILSAMSARTECGVHVVDHLHIISGGGRYPNRLAELEAITRGLKEFAQQNGKVVVLLSQLNRDISKADRSPQLSDLRGSGSIEQDADVVTMLHDPARRDVEEGAVGRRAKAKQEVAEVAAALGEAESGAGDRIWYIRKNRHGGLGQMKLGFDPVTMVFREKE